MKLVMPNFSRFVFASAGKSAAVERWVFAIGLSCCLFGLVGLLRWGPSDPVRDVRVDAKFVGLSATDVWPYVQEVIGEDLLAIDLPAFAERLEQHPWVEKVQLRRVWPDSLIIDVVEPEPFAHWKGLKGEQGFVTQSGVALEAAGTPALGLVYEGDTAGAEAFLQWQKALSQSLDGTEWELLVITKSEFDQWRATLAGADEISIEFRFGERWDETIWERFEQAWAAGLQERKKEIAYIDLRYRGGMAVGWLQHASAAPMGVAHSRNFDLSTWAQAPQGV